MRMRFSPPRATHLPGEPEPKVPGPAPTVSPPTHAICGPQWGLRGAGGLIWEEGGRWQCFGGLCFKPPFGQDGTGDTGGCCCLNSVALCNGTSPMRTKTFNARSGSCF